MFGKINITMTLEGWKSGCDIYFKHLFELVAIYYEYQNMEPKQITLFCYSPADCILIYANPKRQHYDAIFTCNIESEGGRAIVNVTVMLIRSAP